MKKIVSLLSVLVLFCALAYGQARTVTGTVRDEQGNPIPFATITAKGTKNGVAADANGQFQINLTSDVPLVISAVGYASFEAKATNNMVVTLSKSGDKGLDEVVVTAAGLRSTQKALGASQTTLTSDQLVNARPTNVASALSGKVAGLQVSAISSGVNPNYRLVLRGMRSLLGNNQALVVIDNVIVPNSILGNLNPDDIQNITVLNGGTAAALYGSDGSNGALIITTKNGMNPGGKPQVKFSNTTTFESVAYMPKMQKLFGSGSTSDIQAYNQYENQQYGPAFDGSLKPIGLPVEDGSIQEVPYQWNEKEGKNAFWERGLTNQTDISVSSSGNKGSTYFSAQYLNARGTIPGDKYNRATVRLNGVQHIVPVLDLNYSAYYAQNRYNTTSQTANIYNNILNSPGQVPVTRYKDYLNDKFSTPDGYYNAYYTTPYFLAGHYRSMTRNDYFVGNASLVFRPTKSVDITSRLGFTTRNVTGNGTADVYNFSDYTKSIGAFAGTYKVKDITGSYSNSFSYSTKIIYDLIAHAQHKVSDIKFDLTGAFSVVQQQDEENSASISGLVVPHLFNLNNSLTPPSASHSKSLSRTLGAWGKLDVAYRNFLFLTVTGRNDWFSVLSEENRSIFYPSVQLAFTPTDVIPALQRIASLDYLKLRGSWSQVGQVNIAPYSLAPVFSQGAGYPYNGMGGMTAGGRIVDPSLKPELTQGYEAGIDFSLLKNRIKGQVTYYNNTTENQTLPTGISTATGYTSYLLNVGKTSSKGWETALTVVPVRTSNWFVSLGANYTYYDNRVESISADIDRLTLASYGGTTGSYAVAGQHFPVIMGTVHKRDNQGRIIVDPITGYPSPTSSLEIIGRANAKDEVGLNMEVTFKNLTLTATGAYRGGNVIYNALGSTFDFSGAGINTVDYYRERFVIPNSVIADPDNPGKYIPNTNVTVRDGGTGYWTIAGPRTGINENYITSAAFWKLREIALSYEVPKSILGSAGKVIQGVTLSVQARNLFILLPKTNVYTDPEYSSGGNNAIGLTDLGQTPPSRYYGGTVIVNF